MKALRVYDHEGVNLRAKKRFKRRVYHSKVGYYSLNRALYYITIIGTQLYMAHRCI